MEFVGSSKQWSNAVASLLAVLAIVLTFGAGTASAAAAAPTTRGLTATYFDDTALRKPMLKRTDARVHFAWGTRSPSRRIARDTFGARWTGFVTTPRAGRYTFTMRASDGVRVWIDGRLRINRWARADRPRISSSRPLRLARGRHTIRIDYYERTGSANVSLLWKGPGIRRLQVVPAARLSSPARKLTGATQRWSDPATWGGNVPRDGESVTIPAGKAVLLDTNVSLADLTVNGTLQFARRDLTLEADWVLVHGRFQVGAESSPFLQRATIRLRDRTPGENVMNMGDKVLAVMGGTLEMHGQQRLAWTRLGATAVRGSDRITLAKAPDWRPGDRIAIASTDYASSQDEERTVTAVNGSVVTLDAPLEYTHFGVLQNFDGRQVDERAEVALLTRNVTFEDEATSSAGGFGATIMVMDGGVAKVDGAQLHRVGQSGLLRRYPIHFHMLGDAGANSYLRDTSINHSNNRCATIHGTNRVVASGNVCFDHAGHGIFLEDGAERDNVITGNLGFGTKRPADGKRLLGSDESPATFWITNPDNVVRGNVAAGSEGHGFWIALPEHPTGLYAKQFPAETRAMWPRRMALTEFSGNVAHSNDRDGLNFDHGPRPDGNVETTHHHAYANPADTKSRTLVTTMTDFTSFKNRGHGVWLRGTEHRVVRATLVGNAVGATFASDESFLQDSLVVGETANTGTPSQWEVKSGGVGREGRSHPRPWDADFPMRGFEFYDGRVGVERTTFVNFQPWANAQGERRELSALGYKLDNDFSVHPRNFATAVRFVNARQLYLRPPGAGRDGDLSAAFVDTDGSVTGTAGRSVTTTNPFLYGSACAARPDWNAQVCSSDHATLLVGAPGNPGALRPVVVTRPDGQTQTLTASTGDSADDAQTTVLANSAYRVAFTGTPARAQFVLRNGRDRWVRVSIPRAQGFRVTRYGCNAGQSGSWCYGATASSAALDALARSGYWYDDHGDGDAVTGTLHLKLHSAGSDWDELIVE